MNRLQQLFTDSWSVRPREFDTMASLLLPAVLSGNIQAAADQIARAGCTVCATSAPYMARWWELDDVTLPTDSVAVIRLSGMLYSWDSERIVNIMEAVEANPNICGTVLVIDGPGGMTSHLDAAAQAVAESTKPTATVVTGMMASAHFWLGTSADRTFVASPLCEVGSVGVVVTTCSFRKYFEMNGIDYREIYPDTADLKNHAFRVLEETGDETLIKERAEKIHRVFSDTVARNLGISYDPELPLFRGEMFSAADAVSLGYIDQTGNVADAVTWVLAKATADRAAQLY